MQKHILCFHHDDLDGTMAKAVFNLFNESNIVKYISCMSPLDTEWHGKIDYGQFDEIYILDLCFTYEIFERMLIADVYVCDHHKTGKEVIVQLEKEYKNFKSITINWDECATKNLYDYFVNKYGIKKFKGEDFDRKYIVCAVNDFDTWKFEHGSKSHSLCAYLTSMDVNHTTFLKQPRIPEAQAAGKILIEAQDFTINDLLESDRFFFGELDGGHKIVCINGIPLNIRSTLLNKALDKFSIDIAVHFVYYPSYIVVSLRTKDESDIDVSEIARMYGGGGHKNAAGFSVPRSTDITRLFNLEDHNGPKGYFI